jgi:hypothetical protein
VRASWRFSSSLSVIALAAFGVSWCWIATVHEHNPPHNWCKYATKELFKYNPTQRATCDFNIMETRRCRQWKVPLYRSVQTCTDSYCTTGCTPVSYSRYGDTTDASNY